MELLELILEDSNLYKAIDRVVKNDGSVDIDKMSTFEGKSYFEEHKEEIKNALRKREYKPSPIRRVEIPKHDGGIGFGFYYSLQSDEVRVKVHLKSVKRIKDKIRTLTSRSYSIDMERRIDKINYLIIGWLNYFKIASMRTLARELDRMIRRRLRVCIWKAWKTPQRRYKALMKLIKLFKIKRQNKYQISKISHSGNNYAKLGFGILNVLIPKKTLEIKGLKLILTYYTNHLIKTYRHMRNRLYGGVRGQK